MGVNWKLKVVAALAALAAILVGLTVVVPILLVPAPTMSPAIRAGSWVWALPGSGGSASRGDIIVYDAPSPPSRRISRVVAVGGDTVEVVNDQVLINGTPEAGDYLKAGTPTRMPELSAGSARVQVPEGEVYILSDARAESQDSRFFGPISGSAVRQRVVLTSGPSPYVLWIVAAASAFVALMFFIDYRINRSRSMTQPV